MRWAQSWKLPGDMAPGDKRSGGVQDEPPVSAPRDTIPEEEPVCLMEQ